MLTKTLIKISKKQLKIVLFCYYYIVFDSLVIFRGGNCEKERDKKAKELNLEI